ncbi:MAG: TauD/TfdA family dioxygenase, partial [Gammaproteobacteria bacterium]
NDEPIPDAALEKIVALSEAFTVPLNWQDGDIALIDNYRVMHGRYPYSGARKRQVLVCLATD